MSASDAPCEHATFKEAASLRFVGWHRGQATSVSECILDGEVFLERRYGFHLPSWLASAIERLFLPYCEVVFYGLIELGHLIVHVEGTLSGQSVSRTAKEMLFERMRNGETQSGMHSYATSLPSGVKVKSGAISLYRYDRNELVKRLDVRGQFGVKPAAPINVARFCFCQATICNKLREAHDLQEYPS